MTEYCSILRYGASDKGEGDVSLAFAAAFAAGVRYIRIPAGEYRVEHTIYLPSGAHILAEEGAHVFAAPGIFRDKAMLINEDIVGGNEDIAVEGGLWDGRCDENHRPSYFDREIIGLLFSFNRVNGLYLRHLTMQNAVAYHVRMGEVTHFAIEDIHFVGRLTPMCQDGIHMGGGCAWGDIRNVVADPGTMGDDLIAFNADDVFWYGMNNDMKALPIHHVSVEHVRAHNCFTGVRILSIYEEVSFLHFKDMEIGFRVHGINLDAARHCADPIFEAEAFRDGVGNVHDILFEDVTFWNAGAAPDREIVTFETNCRHMEFRRFKRGREREKNVSAPTFRLRYMGKTSFFADSEARIVYAGEHFCSDRDYYGVLTVNTDAPVPEKTGDYRTESLVAHGIPLSE